MARKRVLMFGTVAGVLILVVLAVVYGVPVAREHSQNLALGKRWASQLAKHPGFSGKGSANPHEISFTYAAPSEANLARLRDAYHLDVVAGTGSETTRLINLLTWVFELTGHANEPQIPKELNALSLIPLARDRGMQMNCYMKTVILNEVYLSMGWPSRQTHLLPYEKEEEASHFVTSVYASTLGRWVLMDPDCGAYLTDEGGAILGVREVRQRLAAGRPLVEKGVGGGSGLLAAWENSRNFVHGVSYRWFLTAFIFKVRCPQRSQFNEAAEPNRVHFELIPDGYRADLLGTSKTTASGKRTVYVNDEDSFWQKP